MKQQFENLRIENEKLKNATNSLFEELKSRQQPELLSITDDFKIINLMKTKRFEDRKDMDDFKL